MEKASGESIELPWFVLDGYHFDTAYQSLLRSAGCRLMVIDDTAHLPCYDDVCHRGLLGNLCY
jgi:hypothetical protein